MYILGLTTLGDSAASLIKDGELIAAAEEERFSRVKHHLGFPYKAIQYCLDEAGITLKDVEHVGHYWKPWILRHKAMQAVRVGIYFIGHVQGESGPRHRSGKRLVSGNVPSSKAPSRAFWPERF